MKKAACVIVILLLAALSGYLYHRLHKIKMQSLERSEDTQTLQYLNESLQSQNRKLKRKNRMLRAKLKRQKEAVGRFRAAFKARSRQWIETRLTGVEAQSAPFAGMPAVAALTLADVRTYCEDADSMRKLEELFFGFSAEGESPDEICTPDLNETARKIKKDATAALKRYLLIDPRNEEEVASYWKEEMSDGLAAVGEEDGRIRRYTLKMYEELFDELNVSSAVRRSLDETFNYWKYVFGMRVGQSQ
ncbi:hypothetical protein [Hydrogenimonas urashimensis]|uniref:hypothetical protein n=1 Tax=Hydrogenimonas urashimensis TaxID=2740515 RepID=UPI001915645F|nr:hypothetical protein [Hydrogenimonas urashimensis]